MKRYLILLVFTCFKLYGAVFYEIDTTIPLQCSFSSTHPNRIMIEKEGVERIIHAEPESLQILIEEKAGQAFVIARDEILNPITLCVITTGGQVQDVEVSFIDQPSQLVVLYKKRMLEELPVDNTPCISDSLYMQAIVNYVLTGQIPPGYCQISITQKARYLKRRVCVTEVTRFEKENEILRIYQVMNRSTRQYLLCEEDFSCANLSWVYIDKRKLLSGEQTTVIASVKKG